MMGSLNQCPIVWKSKIATRVIGSTLVEALEWAEYIKFLLEEIVERRESVDLVIYTACKSLKTALKLAGSVKNGMLIKKFF